MKNRTLLMLLALVLLAALLSPGAHAETAQTDSADVSEYVLHAGGLLPEPMVKAQSKGTQDKAVKQALYQGLCAWQTAIDISAYNVSPSDIAAIYTQMLNEHPDLFYVTGGLSWSYSTYVTSVRPSYDGSYSETDVTDYQNTVQRILGLLGADWSDMEKLLFLHDYLVTHCEYDQSLSRHNAHDALVVGSAVCQGYAMAFSDLCLKSGISSVVISSVAINHAWNLVTLGGEYFYIDCTWDDPVNQWYEGYCVHGNFLRSKTGMQETNHNGEDWTDGTRNVYSDDPSSTRYDGAWWSDVITAVPIIGHIGAYTLPTDSTYFYLRNMSTGAISSYSLPSSASWPVFGQPNYSWDGNFCSFAAVNNLFYFTLPTGIWSANPAGQTSSVYALTQDELSQGYAYGIVAYGNTLYYNIGQQGWETEFIRKALPLSNDPVTGECDGFSYVGLSDGTVSVTGCSRTGNVVIPRTLDGYTVTNLASELFYGKSGVTAVTIPATVTGFGEDPSDNNWDYVFSYCFDLTAINVVQGNPTFCSVDGVLYSVDLTTLISYPCSRPGAVYHTEAQTVCCTAFASSRNLKFLFLEAPDAWWYTYAFNGDPSLTVFYKPGGKAEQKAGIDRTEGRVQDGTNGNPWCYLESTGSLCTLPADLQVIEAEAFRGTDIPWVLVPDGCIRIEKDAFSECGLAYLRVGANTVIEGGALAASVVVERG